MKPTRSLLSFLFGSVFLTAQMTQAATYYWDNSNITATPPASLNWFNATQGTWTGGTPVSSNLNTIQFFADTTTNLTHTGNPSSQTSVIDTTGDVAFELGTLTLSGRASATNNAKLNLTISGDALNFSAATGTINLDALNVDADQTITYNVNSNIELGTASSAGALTLTGNGNSTFNIGGIISQLQSGGGSLIKSGTSSVTLTGANSYTGGTTVLGGTLTIGTGGSLSSSGVLKMGGSGTFTYSAAGVGQTVNGLNVLGGSSTVNNTVSGQTLALGAITRTAGQYGLVNFGTLTGPITTTTGNAGSTGIIGAWATTGSAGTLRYAIGSADGVTPTNITALTGTTATAADLSNLTDPNGNYEFSANATTVGNLTANTLRYSGTAASIVNIGASNTLTLNGLLNASTGSGTLTIQGGPSTGGIIIGATNELVINGAGRTTTISSVIADGASPGRVVVGSGAALTLSGVNIFTGGLILNGGRLFLSPTGTDYLGAAGGTVTVNAGSTIEANSVTFNKSFVLNNEAILTFIQGSGTVAISGPVSGTGGVSLADRALTLNSTANTFSGPILFASTGQSSSITVSSLYDGLGAGNIINSSTSRSLTFNLGANAVAPLTLNHRQFVISGGGTMTVNNNNAITANTLNVNTDLVVNSTGAKTFTLGGTNTGTNTFDGNISDGAGTISLTKSDTGTWALSGTNTYSGNTQMTNTAGQLIILGKSALSPNTKLIMERSNTLSLRMDDSGTVNLGNELELSASDTSTGIVTTYNIDVRNNGGATTGSTLVLGKLDFAGNPGNNASSKSIRSFGANGYRLQFGDVDLSYLIAGTATGGPQRFEPQTAPITIAGTVRQISGNTGASTVDNNLYLGGIVGGNEVSGTIADALDFPTNLSATALNVYKGDVNDWTLSGSNSYSGTTTVAAGLLRVNGSVTGSGAVGVTGGALAGTGSLAGAVTLSSTGGIDLRNGSVGTLTLGSTLASTSNATGSNFNNLSFDLGNNTGTSDQISVAGATTVNTIGAAVININQLGGLAGRPTGPTTTYTLIGGAGTLDATNFAKFSLATTKAFGQTYQLLNGGTNGDLQLQATNVTSATPTAFWSGATSVNWNTASNWKDGLAGSALSVGPDYQTNVTFSATGAGNLSTQLDADFDINSLTFNAAAGGVTIASSAAKMLTIEATNANGNVAGNGINSQNTSGTNTISAKVGVASSQSWNVATGGTLAVSGVISDFGGGYSITKDGGGTLTLSGINTFSGPLNIANGTVYTTTNAINNRDTNGIFGSGSSVILGSNGQTGRLAILIDGGISTNKNFTLATGGTGEIQFGNVGGANFQITGADRNFTISGDIDGGGNLVKLGGPALVLSGNNTYSGTTTVNEGALRLGSANALPGGIGATGGTSALTINGNGSINVGAAIGLTAASGDFLRGLGTGSNQFQITGGVSGFEAFGSARQVIVNNDPNFELQWGIATFNPSALLLGYNTVTATANLTLQNKIDLNGANRTITVNASTGIISGVIRNSTGTGGITKTGAGILELSGNNTYNGPTTVNAGTLNISGNHSGNGALTLNAGALNITGNYTGNGATTVNAGTLTLSGASGRLANSAVSTAGGTLTISNTGAANNGDRLSGSLAFTMKGGTFNYNNDASNNSFSESVGTLTIASGVNTVAIQQAGVSGTSTLTFDGLSRTAGTLNFSGAGLGTAVDPRGAITFTSAPTLTNGIIGPWATVNGLGYATLDGGNNVVLYNTYTDVARGTTGTKIIPDSSATDVRLVESTTATNITLAGATTTTIRSLLNSISGGTATAGTIAITGSQTLLVDSINSVSTAPVLNVGNVVGTGTLMAATAGGNLLLINSSANIMTVNSVIANNTNPSSLTKDGSGQLTLATSNSYSGGTVINGGTILAKSLTALGASGSNVTFGGTSTLTHSVNSASGFSFGTVTINAGVTATITKDSTRNGGVTHTIATLTGSGTLAADTDWPDLYDIASASAFNGNIFIRNKSGSTGLTVKVGSLADAVGSSIQFQQASNATTTNTLELTGDTGPLTFNNRQIQILGSNAGRIFTPTLANNNTDTANKWVINTDLVNLGGADSAAKSLGLAGSNAGDNKFHGIISDGTNGGTLGVTKSGTGTWSISNASNTFTGAITLNSTTTSAGTLSYASASGANPITFSQTSGSATLSYIGSGQTMSGAITASALSTGTITLDASGAGAINYSNTGSLGNSGGTNVKNLILSGTNTGSNLLAGDWVNNGTGAATVTKNGAGTWVLSGDNAYTGLTTVNEGTLQFARMEALNNNVEANWTAAKINVKSGATFAVNVDSAGTAGFTDTKLNTLLTNISVANTAVQGLQAGATLGFDTSTATGGAFTQGNVIADSTGSGSFHGSIGLTKLGTGTLVLDKTNTYTGATTVSGGTLIIDGSTAAASYVTVASGATLGGTGTIGGAVNVTGQLSPGASIETLGTGALSLLNGSTLVHEFDSSALDSVASDLLKVTGNLDLVGTVQLTLADLAVADVAFAVNDKFSLINYTGTWNSGLFTFGVNELADEEVFAFGLNTWRISYDDPEGGLNYTGEYAGGSDSFVNLTVVAVIPEPSSALLVGLSSLLLFRRRR
jgi:autotransporter-associated beta strand protein